MGVWSSLEKNVVFNSYRIRTLFVLIETSYLQATATGTCLLLYFFGMIVVSSICYIYEIILPSGELVDAETLKEDIPSALDRW